MWEWGDIRGEWKAVFAVSPTQNKQHNGEKNKQRWSEVGQSTKLSRRLLSLPPPFQPTHIDPIDTSSDTQTAYFVPFPQTLHNLAPRMQDTRPKPLPVFAQNCCWCVARAKCYVIWAGSSHISTLCKICNWALCASTLCHPCVTRVLIVCYAYY